METTHKVTKQAIERKIARVEYLRVPNSTMTICVLTMINGFAVVGESACVDPATFDAEAGESIAFDNAFDKLWALEGYLLREQTYRATEPAVPIVG